MFSPIVERPVDLLAGKLGRLEAAVLLDQHLGARLELLAVGVGPPVDHVAVAVGLRALVVEAVADLVADHRADAAVVDRVVGFEVEERGLEDRGREDDLVHPGVVVGVDRLRGHAPLVAVDRLAELGEVAVDLERGRAADVAHEVVAADLELRVVAPLVGVADLGRELGELLEGLLARSRGSSSRGLRCLRGRPR